MTLREYAMRRYALSENGYRNLKRSTFAVILHDISLIVPVMILFMLVCDVMGDNPYDFGSSRGCTWRCARSRSC